MNEQEQSAGNKGEFFTVNLNLIDKMVAVGAGVEEVMAFVVLARGVNRRRHIHLSTWGANGIANKTGMSYRKAEAALEWLEENKFIAKAPEIQGTPKQKLAKWMLTDDSDLNDVYLANALADGVGVGKHHPPLMRIYDEAKNGAGHLISEARLDAVMVLLYLYRHHELTDCGGINPRAGIYRQWEQTENSYGEKVTDLEGTNAALYEIKGGNSYMFKKFAAESIFYVADEAERHRRFWDAMHNLERLGFVYEVVQVWSDDPNGKNGRKAEPLYTLYINDRHQRKSEPYLQSEIHSTAMRRGALDAYTEFAQIEDYRDIGSTADEISNILGSGRFRYIATKKSSAFPIGIYRLKFRPKTRDTGRGIEAERNRVATWANDLNRIR